MKTIGDLLGEYTKRAVEVSNVSHPSDYIERSMAVIGKDHPRLMRAVIELVADLQTVCLETGQGAFLDTSLHDVQTILNDEKEPGFRVVAHPAMPGGVAVIKCGSQVVLLKKEDGGT